MKQTLRISTGWLATLVLAVLLALPGAVVLAASTSLTTEWNTDRPGSNYKDFDLASANPALCRQACDNDQICQAYTYVKPGVQGPKARCWLKTPAPGRVTNNCCVSGVRSVYSNPSDFQIGIFKDRGGMDYSDFDLPKPDARICLNACRNDPTCRAFTYVAPGYQGTSPRCWLKNGVPGQTSNKCCISGRKTP